MGLLLTPGRALIVPIAVFMWQVVGATRTFTPVEGQRGPSLAGIISLGFIALVVNSGVEPVRPERFVLACLCSLLGLLLFEWARQTVRGQHFSWVFSPDTPTFLCTAGPYTYVRNPFYTSYLLTMTAVVMMVPNVFRALVLAGMVIYFHAAALHEERKFLRSNRATEYVRYRERTGRFLPKFSAVWR